MKCKHFPDKDTDAVVDVNVDMTLLSSATMSNGQGNPLGGNCCRVTPDGHSYITPPGLKAKIRARLLDLGSAIWITKDAVLSRGVAEAAQSIGLDVNNLASDENADPIDQAAGDDEPAVADATPKKVGKKSKKVRVTRDQRLQITQAMAKKYGDFPLFGGVITTPFNVGVRGPIHIGMSFSIDPVIPIHIKITRMAVSNEDEAKGKFSTMGDMHVLRFCVFRTDITVSPFEAAKMGLTWGMLESFIDTLPFIWSHTRAGARGGMSFERLDIWKHAHRGGSVPSEVVFRALTVANLSPDLPTSMKDYHIEVKALRNVTHSLITIQSIMDENEEHSLVAAE